MARIKSSSKCKGRQVFSVRIISIGDIFIPFYSNIFFCFRVTLYSEFLPTASRATCVVLVEVSIYIKKTWNLFPVVIFVP